MERGYLKLYRKIQDNWMWHEKPFSYGHAWIDLLLQANIKDRQMFKRGQVVDVKRGQVAISIVGLADKWGWSQGKVKRFLSNLADAHQIEEQNSNLTTLITIRNYDDYNGNGEQTESRTESKRREDGEKTETPKEVKKEKNNNIPPKIEDVTAYCSERNRGVDPHKWYDFYASKGWMVGKNKMKDWKAAVRTWEKGSEQPSLETETIAQRRARFAQ